MRKCEKCGANIPMQQGRGRRRRMCEACSPSRNRSKAPQVVTPVATVQRSYTGVVASVTAELEAAGMIDSHQGQLALVLAQRIEDGQDSGSAVSQMARQLRETMASALASSEPEAVDPVDELRSKRERRGA